MACLLTHNPYLVKELEQLHIDVFLLGEQGHLAAFQVTSIIVDKIKEGQQGDLELVKVIEKVEEGTTQDFTVTDGILKFRNRLNVPNHPEFKKELSKESNDSVLSTYPGSSKMYRDLKSYYWCAWMKRDIV